MLAESHYSPSWEIKVNLLQKKIVVKKNNFLGDLEHLRAVKAEKHHRFAKDRDMLSYFVSAKTGESVENLFRQVTAHLMHIVLPKNDYDATRIITAPIIRQEANSPTPVKSLPSSGQTRTSICSLQ